ncbi:MAG TPA: protein kinase, partial [bacterium]|nr:protein kinase [bacterium]
EEIQADEKIYRILAIISKELNFKSEEQRYLYLLFENNNLNNDRLKLVRLIELLKQSNDLEKLANVYKKIIADNPENIEYIKSYINVLIMQKKYSELLPLLNRLVSLETQELNFAIERLDMIFDYYDDKIALYKTYIELYGTAGNSAKMEEYYNRLISEHKDAALIQEKIALATIYKETGRETEALKIYENILKFEPENIEILKQSANLYLNCNMMREAKEQFEKILKIQENNEYAQSKIEYLESIVKNSHIMKFQELLNDSMTTEAKKLEILYDLAKAYYDTGFYKLAIDELKKIIKLSNDKILWKRSLELITEIFVVSKQTGLGLQYLANILMKNTGNQREELILKYCVAKLYIAHDEKPKAKALFEEIAVIDDNFEDVQKQLFLLEDVKSSRNDLITLQYGYAMPRELKKSTLERYEIIQELGRGGMGIVYKARDKKLDRIVALKQLPANTDIHSEQAKRLFIEARAVAKLNHHNIVNVFDVGDSEDEMYISMEYVEGKTLTEIIKNEKYVFDEHYVKNIALQICAALDFAHRHNIIHRDIKPDNIMITIDNNIKIMDFGLAKQANENVSMTQEGIAMGTAQYMSPEQIRGEDIDNRTDIYAFGCVLFEMIAAAPPFDSKNINALIYKHLSAKPPNIRSIVATAPEQFELIINKCLEKDKNNRYSNAAEIIEDLKKI